MEVSIVLPALNEEKSIGTAIQRTKEVLSKNKISFEIIVVDSDSEDQTVTIAKKMGAKVVNEPNRGCGNALRRGFREAKGKYIIVFDPDGTYDAYDLPLVLKKLKEGYDYVSGNRFAKLVPGSMSLSHNLGNKIINFMGNFFFNVSGEDMLTGYKGFRAELLKKLDLRAEKWEWNVEIHSKIRRNHLKFIELPINYYPRTGTSKLSGTKAAWDNFRFMLLYSPNFVFIYPAIIFILISIIATINIFMTNVIGNVSMMLSSMMFITGVQMFLFGIMAKNYLYKKGLDRKNILNRLGSNLTLEKGILVGLVFLIISIIIFIFLLIKWLNSSRNLQVIDVEFGIMGFTSFITSISIITYSFMNQILQD